ncbi:GerW family sporulation protein [Tenuibacillus multivorans]|uniref:Sporulation protein YtfJ n=1 Tax=Tenuibacillus multivorans TaxID=237069 RepID=A0A1G9ZXF4_9BACI|nr:GerW family sporulation protein [Tenuibacillus multivorans]GEL76873.1 putative spore protein YtfJ [Tenuibacillus multivorans]SDN25383.1 sporulation protein YtfJ [Tenuibacillus multivorans]
MNEHPIHDMMVTSMENLKDMIDVNTIIGDPIETPDQSTVILPVSKVGFGYAAGGSEFKGGQSDQGGDQGSDNQSSGPAFPFGGGTGGGVSINPIGFLVVQSDEVKMVHLDQGTHIVEKLIDLAPQAVEKVQSYLQNRSNQSSQQGRRKKQDRKQERNQGPSTPE